MLPQVILFCCLRCSLNHREYNLIDEKLIKALFFHFFRERYRDLIDAADTVTDMKTCAGQVSIICGDFNII